MMVWKNSPFCFYCIFSATFFENFLRGAGGGSCFIPALTPQCASLPPTLISPSLKVDLMKHTNRKWQKVSWSHSFFSAFLVFLSLYIGLIFSIKLILFILIVKNRLQSISIWYCVQLAIDSLTLEKWFGCWDNDVI